MSEQEYEYLDSSDDLSQVPVPGQLVRQTREQRGLSIDEMSARTRLTENVLHMVEHDDYRGMGEPVYARGYYRKCADALGLNGDLLVEAYERHSGTMSPVPTIDQRPSIAYREGPGRLALGVAVALILLVFGATAIWFWQKDDGSAALAKSVPTPMPQVATPAPDTSLARAPSQQAESDTTEVIASEQPVVTPAPEATPMSVRPQATPAAPTIAAATPAVPAQVVSVSPQVRVEVKGGEAWLDVRDPAGTKLLYKLLQPGSVREFTGQPPFKLTLGRADNVRIWFQGKAVPFESQIENDLRAFFYIDAQGRVSDEVTP